MNFSKCNLSICTCICVPLVIGWLVEPWACGDRWVHPANKWPKLLQHQEKPSGFSAHYSMSDCEALKFHSHQDLSWGWWPLASLPAAVVKNSHHKSSLWLHPLLAWKEFEYKGENSEPGPWRPSRDLDKSVPRSSKGQHFKHDMKSVVLASPFLKGARSILFTEGKDNNAKRQNRPRSDCQEEGGMWQMTWHFQRHAGGDNKSTHIFICDQRKDLWSLHLWHTLPPLTPPPPRTLTLHVRAIRMNLPGDIFDPPPARGWNFPRVTLSSGHLLSWPSATLPFLWYKHG